MTPAHLTQELAELNAALSRPQHYSPLQLRAFRKRKAKLMRQLEALRLATINHNRYQQPLFL